MTTPEHLQDAMDPFLDSAVVDTSDAIDDSTLMVGRDASLTLGTDSLIIHDQGLSQSASSKCCGLLPSQNASPTRAIPFFNILWAAISDFDLTIHYAAFVTPTIVRPAYISYSVDKPSCQRTASWLSHLLDRVYGSSQRRKRIKVLVNPFGGKGAAQKLYVRDIEPIFAAARCDVEVERTQYSGHAVELAERLDTDAWDVVACCSGDGLPHEVFNGLGRRKDAQRALAKVAVVQLPCGSGNAMSLNLNGTNSPSLAALCVVKGLRTPLDLVSVTQGERRTLSFLSQSVGIVAETDLGTDHLRWMGDARFTYGFLVRLLGKTVYPCDIALDVVDDSKSSIKARYQSHITSSASTTTQTPITDPRPPTAISNQDCPLPALRFGTVLDPLPPTWRLTPNPTLGNFYAGNMPLMAASATFFPYALPSDGNLDLICIPGDISRLAAVQCLLAVGNGGSLIERVEVAYRKVRGYRVVPRGKEGFISIDGEKVPFEPFQVEVHERLGTVLSRSGRGFEGAGGV